MATYLIQDTTLSSIADAIRAKAGTSSAFTPAQMVSEIENLPTGGEDVDAFIERTFSVIENSTVSQVGTYAFYNCSVLTSVNLPLVTTIGSYAFASCSALTSVNLPLITSIANYAFRGCTSLTSVNLPLATSVGGYAFYSCFTLTSISLPLVTTINSSAFAYCSALTSINLPSATRIGNAAFTSCYNLLSLYLTNSIICSLPWSGAFTSTPIAGYTESTGGVYGSIYVLASLLASYKTEKIWSYFSSRFVGI